MWKEILEAFQKLFVLIKCSMCCKSNCSVQVGNNSAEEVGAEQKVKETAV